MFATFGIVARNWSEFFQKGDTYAYFHANHRCSSGIAAYRRKSVHAQAQVVVQGGIGVAPYYAPGYARPGIYAGAYPYSYPAYGGYYVGPRVSVGISPFFYGGYRGYYGRPGVYGGWGYRGYGYGRGRR